MCNDNGMVKCESGKVLKDSRGLTAVIVHKAVVCMQIEPSFRRVNIWFTNRGPKLFGTPSIDENLNFGVTTRYWKISCPVWSANLVNEDMRSECNFLNVQYIWTIS